MWHEPRGQILYVAPRLLLRRVFPQPVCAVPFETRSLSCTLSRHFRAGLLLCRPLRDWFRFYH
jgi:hypothetical protein